MAIWTVCGITVWALIYAALCWLNPFGTCRRCMGSGERPSLLLGRPRPCSACRTTGRRLRLGRRAFNATARRRQRQLRTTGIVGGQR